MCKKFKLVCSCGFEKIVINEDVFLENDIKCSICGGKCDVVNINNVVEIYEELVSELGLEGLIEFIKDKEIEEENKDLIEYLKYKGLWKEGGVKMYKITGIGNAICNDGKEEYVDIVDYDYKCNSIEEVLSVIKKCLETGFIKIEIRNEYKEV